MTASSVTPAASGDWKPSSASVDPLRFPDIADLMERLHFAPSDGRIWLDDQRMSLIHTSAMGVLRHGLIEGVGLDRARGLLTRMGYNSGAHDAQLARKLRPNASLEDIFSVGPQLHALEGIVLVEPVSLEIDVERGKYRGEYIWRGSSEDEEHVRIYGIGAEVACWMQIGYASGFTSVFMGRPILFREVECRAQGKDYCRIVGMPVEDWDDAEDDHRHLQAEAFSRGLSAAARGSLAPEIGSPNAEMFADGDIVGASTGFNSVCHMVKRVADTRATVLFLGESGVGKEVFARTLHRISPRADKAFVAVNCAAIPDQLVESELFGVEKGAYTGASSSRAGRFERAHEGTLFLDEIGILNLTSQGKLLRALQQGEIERVGDTHTRRVDVRLIAATNLDLKQEVRAGRFREDLYYRLNVFPIKVPPLRERREDVPILMNHFLRKFCAMHGRSVTGFTARAIDAILTYDLPGNIRELENMIERGVILAPAGGAIDLGHLFTGGETLNTQTFSVRGDGRVSACTYSDNDPDVAADSSIQTLAGQIGKLMMSDAIEAGTSLDEIEASLESALLKSAVERAGGNLSAAARILGITRARLVYRLNGRNIGIDDRATDGASTRR